MTNFQIMVLSKLSKDLQSVKSIAASTRLKRMSKERLIEKIEDTMDVLEQSSLIENLAQTELEALKSNKATPEGALGEPTEFYAITNAGEELLEEIRQDNFKFYAPFIISTALGLLSIIVSITAIMIAVFY